MSLDPARGGSVVATPDDLVAFFVESEKRSQPLSVGLEHEKLLFDRVTLGAVPYPVIAELLEDLRQFGWQPLVEDEAHAGALAAAPPRHLIGLTRGAAHIALEPGGQLELAGAPWRSLFELGHELEEHLVEVELVARPRGVVASSLGLRPWGRPADAPRMPRARYAAMSHYLAERGRDALTMMLMTASVQASFDYVSERDMIEKMRCARAVSPIVTALAASSPFHDDRFSGYRSHRYAVWQRVDPQRCGLLDFVDEEDFGYRRYVDWAIDVPLMFVRRAGAFVPADGRTFRDWLRSASSASAHEAPPTLGDFRLHLSTLFPEVRLKETIEVRGADACPPEVALGVVALWKGLLYDEEARLRAVRLLAPLSRAERAGMQLAVAQDGLLARGAAWRVDELANELLHLAVAGLRRAGSGGRGDVEADEAALLAPLWERARLRLTAADELVARFGAGPLSRDAARQLLAATILAPRRRANAVRPRRHAQP